VQFAAVRRRRAAAPLLLCARRRRRPLSTDISCSAANAAGE